MIWIKLSMDHVYLLSKFQVTWIYTKIVWINRIRALIFPEGIWKFYYFAVQYWKDY